MSSKLSLLEWTKRPRQDSSAFLLRAETCSTVSFFFLNILPDVFKSETKDFSVGIICNQPSGPDWLKFYDDQFGQIDGDDRNNGRLIEHILDSGKNDIL